MKFVGRARAPFYELARPYVKGTVLDIGAGKGDFFATLGISERPDTIALESNKETVEFLKKRNINARIYEAPARIPFDDGSVSLIHASHVVEHLDHDDLYTFLKEADRVLAPGGALIISTPLLYGKFYDDLSHVKPYNPQVFINYLVEGAERTREVVSNRYTVSNLVYRWGVRERELYSVYAGIDFLLDKAHSLASILGFRRYEKTGYTIILEKR